jgi:hypothetical protein
MSKRRRSEMESEAIVGGSVESSEPVASEEIQPTVEPVATEETVVAIRNNLTQGVTVSYWKNGVPCDVTVQPSGSVVCDLEVFESAHYKDLALAGVVTQIQSPRRK